MTKLNNYFSKSIRRIKHRKGFGVHSPFAFAIITEVIEEKLPYYAYSSMQRRYDKKAPIPFKVVCLLFRLANRFSCRNIAILGDEQYARMPLTEVDSRNNVSIFSDVASLAAAEGTKYDMIVVNQNPFQSESQLADWVLVHAAAESVVFAKGIQPRHSLESFWDAFSELDDVPITMDLFDYGLAILKPNFFKQHYIVSF